ncbi:hypothetical protein Tco_0247308 [Tanacetum coccineum]
MFSSGGALFLRRGVLLLLLTNKGWVDGNGLNLGGGFGKRRGGLETRGGEDGLEGPDGQLSMVGVKMIDIILYNVIYLGFNGIGDSWSCGSSRIQVRKQNIEVSAKSEDGYEVINIEDDENNHNNVSNGAGRSTKRKLDEAIKVEISSSDESEEENGDENGSGDTSTSKSDESSSDESDESSSDESNEDGSDGEDLYTPEFLKSLEENTGYWQEPNSHVEMGEQVATSPMKKKKPNRNLQKRTIQTDDEPRQIAWTTEEKIMLAKGWVAVSENSKHSNAQKQDGFWCEDVLKDGLKLKEIAFRNFNTGSEGGSKRHKSSGSSLFNTESGDASINLNTNVVDEDVVQDIRRPGGKDKARAAGKKRIKIREVECHEREVAAQEYRAQQEDIRFYLQPYDHLTGDQWLAMNEARAKMKAEYDL